MSVPAHFDELLEAIDKLGPEDQESLLDIVKRRQIANRRTTLASEIAAARQEFQAGTCRPETVKNLIGEILS